MCWSRVLCGPYISEPHLNHHESFADHIGPNDSAILAEATPIAHFDQRVVCRGSQLIAAGSHRKFVALFGKAASAAAGCAAAAVVGAALYSDAVAFDFGETACIYRTDPHCAAEYALPPTSPRRA